MAKRLNLGWMLKKLLIAMGCNCLAEHECAQIIFLKGKYSKYFLLNGKVKRSAVFGVPTKRAAHKNVLRHKIMPIKLEKIGSTTLSYQCCKKIDFTDCLAVLTTKCLDAAR
jgi:hypothetical protein